MTDEPIRILRVIARLNVGGPALHVTYLCRGARQDRLRDGPRGRPGRARRGLDGGVAARATASSRVYIGGLQRDIEPRKTPRRSRGCSRSSASSGRTSSTRTRRRPARSGGSRRCSPGRHARGGRPHLPRARPPRLLQPGRDGRRSARSSGGSPRSPTRSIAVSPEVRDDLVRARGRAGRADRRSSGSGSTSTRARRRRPTPARSSARRSGSPTTRFLIGWLGRMTEIKRVDDLLRAFARAARAAASTPTSYSSATGRCARARGARARRSASPTACHFVGYRDDVGSLYARLRRGRAHVGERGDAGDADRGARRRRAGRRDRRRRRAGRRRRRRRGFLVPGR